MDFNCIIWGIKDYQGGLRRGGDIMFPWNVFPFNKDMKHKLKNMKPEEINQFIQGVMGNIMPSQFEDMMNRHTPINQSQQKTNSSSSSVFETHDAVFVRLPVKNEELLQQIRIYHTANQIIVNHIPERNEKQTITLPALVRKKGATAKYKEGILEIKLIKSNDLQFSQIDISEL